MVTLLCSLLTALGACADDDWVLTGLARTDGQVRVYLTTSAGSTFVTLRPGEENGGWRLAAVSFRERCVWLANTTRTTRVEFALSPAQATSQWPQPRVQQTRQTQDFSGQTSSETRDSLEQPVAADSELAVTGDTSALPAGAVVAPSSPDTAVTDSGSASKATQLGPRRAPTADELFKSRNGYGAWESLLRRRHQAATLGIPVAEP